MLRYSASADTVLRKWLPIADTSKAESLVFPGDAVEFLRLPPGRSAAARGGGAVGVADSVAPGTSVLKKIEPEVVSDAHDNSKGGVNVINKHEDKVHGLKVCVCARARVRARACVCICLCVTRCRCGAALRYQPAATDPSSAALWAA